MTDKTEAQRLADLIRPTVPCQHRSEAAALLLKQEAAIRQLREALDASHSLAIGWATHYQYMHKLSALHEEHDKIIKASRAALTATEGL